MSQKQKLQQRVEEVLEEIPETRNSDITLAIELYKKYHSGAFLDKDQEYLEVEKLINLPRINSISRVRRRIQNEKDIFLPTRKEVAKQRRISEDRWKQYAKNKNII